MPFRIAQTGTHFPFSTLPEQDFRLAAQRIDIWQYPLTTLWSEAETLLNTEELQRAKRFHFERHQRRFTIARAMLRLILARYLDLKPHDLEFSTNAYGKPFLTHPSQIQFNLSHSQDLALLAIGQEHPVGIDIEFFSSRPFQGISNLMFSAQEIQSYERVPANIRALAFFHVWAQKEAFIKASGMGLSYPTQTFDVPVFPPTDAEIVDERHAMLWRMRSFMPKIACWGAVCHHPSIQTLRYRALTQDPHAFK